MECNKEEAERCISIALKHFAANDTVRAAHFLKKSIRLYPTDKATRLLQRIEGQDRATSPEQEPEQQSTFTEEQQVEVSRIMSAGNDYYKILNISKTADVSELKRAYRKVIA